MWFSSRIHGLSAVVCIIHLLYRIVYQEVLLDYHIYADYIQINVTFNPTDPNSINAALSRLSSCITEIQNWMTKNYLKLNQEKTEFFLAASGHHMQNVSPVLLKVGNESSTPADTIRNLGVIFDAQLTMAAHIKSLCTSLNYQLRNVSRIRRFLDHDTCHLIVRALILSRMDYSNGFLLGSNYNDIQRLQRIQNWSSKLIYRAKKFDHASPYLQELHWLPVRERGLFLKIMTVVYKCLTGTAPSYLTACLSLFIGLHVPTEHKFCRLLQSAIKRSFIGLHVPTEHKFRRLLQSAIKRSFTYKAPHIWNTLPTNIRENDSLSSFKKCLKTHLFAGYC